MPEALSKTDYMDRLQRAKGTISRMREEGQSITRRGLAGVLTIGGGATVGAMRGFWGGADGNVYIPGTEIDADGALGSLLALGATLGLAGDASDYLGAYGFGILSAVTSRETEEAIKAAKKAAPK